MRTLDVWIIQNDIPRAWRSKPTLTSLPERHYAQGLPPTAFWHRGHARRIISSHCIVTRGSRKSVSVSEKRSWSTDPVVRCHGARRERICMYLLGMQRKSSSRKICVVNGSWNVFSMAVTTPRRERHRRMPAHIFFTGDTSNDPSC